MPPQKKRPVERAVEQVTPLTDVITSLDSVRAYRRRASENLEEKFKRLGGMGYSGLSKLWWEIVEDVERITEMPLHVPNVPGFIRLNMWLRLIGRISFIVLVFIVAARFVRAWRPYIGDIIGENLLLLIAVVVVSMVAVNGEIVIDFMIRKRIVKYEVATQAEYAPHVESLKRATQTVINQLAKELKRGHKDPKDFPFHLFFDDYGGTEITATKVPKAMFVFKRKFKVYTAIAKLD